MTDDAATAWVTEGHGPRPRVRWTFSTEAALLAADMARETGEVLAADASGGLSLLDRGGRMLSVTRGLPKVWSVVWSDTGRGGAAIVGESRLCRFNRRLDVQWSLDLPDTILALAVDPYGEYTAVSLAGGTNLVLNSRKTRISRFETDRPLSHLQFMTDNAAALGAAEYGLLGNYRLDGRQNWQVQMLANIGDLAVAGNAIFLANFVRGIQVLEMDGASRETYVIEGTPHRVAASVSAHRLAVGTLEGHFYRLDSQGEMLWTAELPDELVALMSDPFGNWMVCGFASGRMMQLDWGGASDA